MYMLINTNFFVMKLILINKRKPNIVIAKVGLNRYKQED